MHEKGFSIKTLLSILILMFVFSAAIIIPAHAQNGSMTLVCRSSGNPLEGAHWSAYRIGSRNDTGGFTLEGSFSKYNVTIGTRSSDAATAAYTFETYAKLDKIQANASGSTDNSGQLKLIGLSKGIYLISGTERVTESYKFTPSPSIVEVGGFADDDITVYPKYVNQEIPKPEKVNYSVRKIWSNDVGAEYARPNDITVELYANDKLDRTVKLDASNGWYYEWNSDKTVSWRVKETGIPEGYTVSYGMNETEFLIVNTYNPPPSTTEPHTTATTVNTTAATNTTTTTTTTVSTTSPPPGVTTVTTTLPPREELEREVEEFSHLIEDDYTPESWREFIEAYERAMKVLGASDSTEEEIRLALQELEIAKSHLVYGYESWLPQTGQLWWPVPVLAGVGLVLIAIGVRIIVKKGVKNDKTQ